VEEGPRDDTRGSSHGLPVRVDAQLDEPLSRWLWLVKWLLAIPHFVVLAFLWIAFALLWVVASSRSCSPALPRAVFDFTSGAPMVVAGLLLRLGTLAPTVPPFTLAEVPDYRRTRVAYPDTSPGAGAVKWWLLALPHYVVVGCSWAGELDDVDVSDQTVVQPGWPG